MITTITNVIPLVKGKFLNKCNVSFDEGKIVAAFADFALDVFDAQPHIGDLHRHQRAHDVGVVVVAVDAMAQERNSRTAQAHDVQHPAIFERQTDFVQVGKEIFGRAETLSEFATGQEHIVDEPEFVTAAGRTPTLPEHVWRRLGANDLADVETLLRELGSRFVFTHAAILVFFATSACAHVISLLFTHHYVLLLA